MRRIMFFPLVCTAMLAVWGCRQEVTSDAERTEIVSDSSSRAHDAEQGGMYRDLQMGYRKSDSAPRMGSARILEQIRKHRAFDGAPPWIPHAVSPENERTGTRNCLNCHRDGGWVEKWQKYAPPTPHPEWTSCRQCHVPGDGGDAFRPSGWKTPAYPALNDRSQPAGPPAIPHSVQYRGNCLACHAGPSAPVEIRTTHPGRTNCRQCHVPANSDGTFPESKI